VFEEGLIDLAFVSSMTSGPGNTPCPMICCVAVYSWAGVDLDNVIHGGLHLGIKRRRKERPKV